MKLSIGLVAYNHAAFIQQAVAGIISQRTNFDYEVIVGEDCSTDRTLEILLRLQAEHPEKIRILDTPQNLGMTANYFRTFQACCGEYVALLDGDDYWCDEYKLQRQVDFLDGHPEYSISFHPVRKIYEDGRPERIVRPRRVASEYALEDLLFSMFITTCSAVVRNAAVGDFPDWVSRMKTSDYPIMVLAAGRGKIGYMDEVMSVYRVHSGGAWSSMAMIDRLITNILLLENANPYFDYRCDAVVHSRLQYYWNKLSNEFYDLIAAEPAWDTGHQRLQALLKKLEELESTPPGWLDEQVNRALVFFFLQSYKTGAYGDAWDCWTRLVRANPSIMLDRGMMILGAGSAFGGRLHPTIQWMRRTYHRLIGEQEFTE